MIATACLGLILMAAAVAAAAVQPRFDVAAYRPAAAKTPYARPLEVGGWSRIDGEHFFDKRALRRYRAPKLPASLSSGYNDFLPKRDEKDTSERCLLAAVERYAEQTSGAHFVTYRNNLNKLLATLHCPNDDWCIGVKRLAGDQRWLLRVRDTPRRRDEERSQSDAQRLMSYFGYRFEALCTGHDPAKPVDANDEYVEVADDALLGKCSSLLGFGNGGEWLAVVVELLTCATLDIDPTKMPRKHRSSRAFDPRSGKVSLEQSLPALARLSVFLFEGTLQLIGDLNPLLRPSDAVRR